MKKIFLFCMLTLLSCQCFAINCENGNIITAKNGTKFCESTDTKTRKEAAAWCEALGLSMASFSDMCPGIPVKINHVIGACPNLQGVGSNQEVWAPYGVNPSDTLSVNLNSGSVGSARVRHNHTAYWHVFCK